MVQGRGALGVSFPIKGGPKLAIYSGDNGTMGSCAGKKHAQSPAAQTHSILALRNVFNTCSEICIHKSSFRWTPPPSKSDYNN